MQIARVPGPAVRGVVLGYRGFRLPPIATRRRLILPDAIAKVMIGLAEPVRVLPAVGDGAAMAAASLVNPLRATASVGEHTGRIEGITVLFDPLSAYRVFGPVLGELGQAPTALDDLLPGAAELVERLAGHPPARAGWAARFRLLDDAFAARLGRYAVAPEVAAAWSLLRARAGRVATRDLAAETGWSVRRLQRRFAAHTGLAPRAVAAVLRLQRSLRLHADGASWTRAAAEAGFYDQPQFNRAFRAMVGRTPRQFEAQRRRSDPGDAADFVPGQVTSTLLSH
ncbi:helix-turn-helix domain-containing protein [Dactylosporangium darangshiense]|uniref:HTH araC/xylS-type domain-containing protein n=1 Tax=Dactylosporangium darangshiense TaxID=579108 RepID=A0ABP8DC57_9ACTN